jgi:hypothetical protein
MRAWKGSMSNACSQIRAKVGKEVASAGTVNFELLADRFVHPKDTMRVC